MDMLRNLVRAGALTLIVAAAPAGAQPAVDGDGMGTTIAAGRTGFDVRRPVFASACPHACPWGELGEYVQEAMAPLGYEVLLCRNCNRTAAPRVVSRASVPPPLDKDHIDSGTTTRLDAPVDFGVTESGMLAFAYRGEQFYKADGPMPNLRLIARIEDPTYLLVAVPRSSDIRSLADAAAARRPLRILSDMEPSAMRLLASLGLSPEEVTARGGAVERISHRAPLPKDFDLIVGAIASPAMNPESAMWTAITHHMDMRFLDIPAAQREMLVNEMHMRPVTARWGLLKGIDRNIETVGRSGEAFFTRADIPEQAAYDVARAIDQNRNRLIWFVRPYSYDPRTVTSNLGVPLHPGAERYYREMGYLRD